MWPMSSMPTTSSSRSLRNSPRRWRSHADQSATNHQVRARQALERWIAGMIERTDEWSAYLITFMFNNLPGSSRSKLCQMNKEIEHFYTNLITRIIRKPNQKSNLERCPRLFAFPDLPRIDKNKSSLEDVTINDGLHFHGVLLTPIKSRLKCDLGEHIATNQRLYLGGYGKLRNIHVRKITFNQQVVTDYVFKLWKRDPESAEWLIVLPRSQSELARQMNAASAKPHDGVNR